MEPLSLFKNSRTFKKKCYEAVFSEHGLAIAIMSFTKSAQDWSLQPSIKGGGGAYSPTPHEELLAVNS